MTVFSLKVQHRHQHKLSRRDHRDHQRIVSRERTFVALYDYDPFTMGTTDRPDLQLSLKKGDTVIVLGDEDVEGYFTAVVNGKEWSSYNTHLLNWIFFEQKETKSS